MEIEKEVLKGYIDTILLSLLREKAVYGYELARTALERSEGTFTLKEATLYLALKRLEKNGLVEAGHGRLSQKKAEWEFVKKTIDRFLEGVEA
ncbi:PadR family transcriptional regulator PadR [Paenibacillus forsythiae]|uniref:PadR family transcriptional regulator PadR n=1 Tax=Paenibacillus forsythiae TaxID=365616 RepID=A0ABU3HCX2_9BACL|nr:helix-turn-helix transcriptional regulator [Paenibacillus forsythiae]MDT3428665.1 PadR family transcriptional regulator PadR [Paenibacillus forsythiae]